MATQPTERRPAAAPSAFRVREQRRETRDTWTLELQPVSGEPLVVKPGQFTMLYAFGVGEVPISVSGDSAGPLVHTIRAVGAVTTALCDARHDRVVGVRGPFGNAWPLDEAIGGDVVVIAGGIGLAPLRPVIYDALRARERFRRVTILYGSRTPHDLLYRDELESWPAEGADVDVTVDAADSSWPGKVGVVAKLIDGAGVDPAATTAFVCGPEIMMHFTARALLEEGVPAERIFLSMERNMSCGVGHCGHCQLGSTLICRDGPVYRYDELEPLLRVREL
jgi:anaerobic sulfite reductase subunit B